MSTSTSEQTGLDDLASRRIDPDRLGDFIRQVFEQCGMPAMNAEILANHLMWADLRGLSSSGANRVPQYVARLRSDATPAAGGEPRSAFHSDGFLVIDADDAFGEVVGYHTMRRLVRIARSASVSAAVVRDTTDAGTLGRLVSLAVDEQMIGIAVNRLPSAGVGSQSVMVASPAGRHSSLLLDMASTKAPIDPIAALDELLLPMSGHRGLGLAVLWEVLNGVLSASTTYSSEDDSIRSRCSSMLLLVIDPAVSMPYATFTSRVDDLIDQIPAADRIGIIPQRRTDGVPLSNGILKKLAGIASDLGIAPCDPLTTRAPATEE